MHTMVENRSVIAGGGGMIVTEHDKTFVGDGNVQYLDCGDIYLFHVCLYLP